MKPFPSTISASGSGRMSRSRALSRIARAQAYPTRPVRIVVSSPPGGTADFLARVMGQWLSERLGQPFVIENKGGSGNNIAARRSRVRPPTAIRCSW